eukprot:8942782-Lingulodinium_polyedra.AAC.1
MAELRPLWHTAILFTCAKHARVAPRRTRRVSGLIRNTRAGRKSSPSALRARSLSTRPATAQDPASSTLEMGPLYANA